MSLLDINIDDPSHRDMIQKYVRQYLANAFPKLNLPDKLELRIERKQHHIAVAWDGKVEAVLRGLPDPDMIRARVYDDHAVVDLRFSGIRIDYS